MSLFGEPRIPRELLDRLESSEREIVSMKLQWAELLDKVQRWMQRTIKRDARELPEHDQVIQGDGLDPISRRLMQQRSRRVLVRPHDEET